MLTTIASGTSSSGKLDAWVFAPDQIEHIWPEMEPFVLDGLRYCKGELCHEDVKRLLLSGGFTAFATVREEKLQLVMIVELVQWPHYKSVRIVALAGSGLAEASQFLPSFEAWCLALGAVEIEAWTRPVMTRLLQRWSFNKAYDMVRHNLRGRLQ